VASSTSGTAQSRNDSHTVDPADEPSAEWGWHGSFPRTTRVAGWLSSAFLLLMLIGNHHDWLADAWLIGLATIMISILLVDAVRGRGNRF
jgi:hypothetical protein